jgi:hypothetical protein
LAHALAVQERQAKIAGKLASSKANSPSVLQVVSVHPSEPQIL